MHRPPHALNDRRPTASAAARGVRTASLTRRWTRFTAHVVTVLLLMFAPVAGAFADVVPPRAVEVAEGWLSLTDQGRHREAVETYGDVDRGKPPAPDIDAAIARLAVLHPPRVGVTRSIRSWAGHGTGDVSAMAPGAYFSLVFDTVDGAGTPGTDEVRMVPRGDGEWKVLVDRKRR